ncbi:pyruvate kinase [Mrakia frigida]|uniref:pyruvate kinase n=1 Tax=Mrakia frigida TaxID=29902 RepID=UPI003FCC1B6A
MALITKHQTAIIATIGPAINTVEKVQLLRDAGANIIRMNFSHGDHASHQAEIDMVQAAVRARPDERPLALALDTKGPGIRTGSLEGGDVQLQAGDELYITTDPSYAQKGTRDILYIDYPNIVKVTSPGKLIYVDDGVLALQVISIEGDKLRVRAVNTAVLSSRKGVNLPRTKVDLPPLSQQDKRDLQFGVKNGIDMVFASYMRSAKDVLAVRAGLGVDGTHVKVIAKIENEQGVINFDEILAAADGIMVARGDLGIEIPSSQVFMAQKMMIAKCNVVGKPVAVATQMLESMTVNPRPTRAEVSDVANAILDGADAVMLSAETARGSYPMEAVKIMSETCFLAESSICHAPLFNDIRDLAPKPTSTNETTSVAAVSASVEQNASAILVLTTSGVSAALLSKYRPSVPILAISRSETTARALNLHRGVYPLLYPEASPLPGQIWQNDVDNRLRFAMKKALAFGMVKSGDSVVCLQGWKGGIGHTNTLRVLTVPIDLSELERAPLHST